MIYVVCLCDTVCQNDKHNSVYEAQRTIDCAYTPILFGNMENQVYSALGNCQDYCMVTYFCETIVYPS